MFAYQDLQAQASRAYQPQSETYQTVGASQCVIGLFPQTYLNAPNGTTPAASNTIPAVIAPQFFYTICSPQPVAAALQNGGYAPYGPSLAYANCSGYMPAHSMMPYPQARQGHMAECQGAMHKDVLGLDNSRGFYSTNDLALRIHFMALWVMATTSLLIDLLSTQPYRRRRHITSYHRLESHFHTMLFQSTVTWLHLTKQSQRPSQLCSSLRTRGLWIRVCPIQSTATATFTSVDFTQIPTTRS